MTGLFEGGSDSFSSSNSSCSAVLVTVIEEDIEAGDARGWSSTSIEDRDGLG